jgi:hypothetical protein
MVCAFVPFVRQGTVALREAGVEATMALSKIAETSIRFAEFLAFLVISR